MSNIFGDFLDTPVKTLTHAPTQIVKNKFPSLTHTPYRIAIVGEAPGESEVLQGQPFVGQSGKLLTGLLTKANILREACFIGNVCQHRPPSNDISSFDRDGIEIQVGLEQLTKDLQIYNPNICLLLGRTALWAASGNEDLGNRRGSMFQSNQIGPFLGRKCIASYHPAAVLRQYDWIAYLWFDILKCLENAKTPQYEPTQRTLEINLTAEEIVSKLEWIRLSSLPCSVDIEGGLSSLPCCSFSTDARSAFIVPFQSLDGTSYWKTEEEEEKVWKAFADTLAAPNVPKIFQNGLYDRFVLQYGYGIICLGNTEDTMLKFWEKFCELEKGLASQASILTDEPYWKWERKAHLV